MIEMNNDLWMENMFDEGDMNCFSCFCFSIITIVVA